MDKDVVLPSSTQEIQRQMEELNKKIAKQKSEINSISQNIASTASTEIGKSALANIALPSNLQQILDSIKTIGAVSTGDNPDIESTDSNTSQEKDGPINNLTIPLMIPKSFSRPLSSSNSMTTTGAATDGGSTIPLNIPSINRKSLSSSLAMDSLDKTSSSSVLGALSEEELIRKAAEMLGETDEKTTKQSTSSFSSYSPSSFGSLLHSNGAKRAKLDLSQPPVPGLEDEDIV